MLLLELENRTCNSFTRKREKRHPAKLFSLTLAIHGALEQIQKERIKDIEAIGK